MPTIGRTWEQIAAQARDDLGWSHEEYLAAVLERPAADRESAGTMMRIRTAHFPAIKTPEDFNYDHLPSLRRDLLAHLSTSTYVAKAENVVLLGPPGTGKTHPAVGLGQGRTERLQRAVRHRQPVDQPTGHGPQRCGSAARHRAGRRSGTDRVEVGFDPGAEFRQRPGGVSPERGERVVHTDRDRGYHCAGDEPVFLQSAHRSGEYLRAHALEALLELREALRTGFECADGQGRPFARQDLQDVSPRAQRGVDIVFPMDPRRALHHHAGHLPPATLPDGKQAPLRETAAAAVRSRRDVRGDPPSDLTSRTGEDLMTAAPASGGATMRAVGIRAFGGPEVLTPMVVPRPSPLPTEILVRVHAAGVNPLDLRTRAGLPTPAAAALGSPPHILGWDVSGVVEDTGHGEFRFAPGDEVFGLLWLPRPAGAYAEYVTAPSRQFARKPASIDHRHAAALPLAGLTAWQVLTDIACLRPGHRILVHAAGGGVGHLAVQLAKYLGAHVTATASAAKHDWLRTLGADELIDYRTTPFEDAAHDMDVVLDLVGIAQPDTAPRSLQVLRPGGLYLGVAPGRTERLTALAAAAGVRVAPEPLVEPDGHGLDQLARLIDDGALRVHLDRVFPLDHAAEAHAHAERGANGKTVLQVARGN